MRRLGVTRRQVFERVERAALASLPGETTNSPNGVWSVSRPIITSSSKASFIPSPMPSFASRSILEQRRAPSRSFTAASASPSISAAMAAVVMEPTQITCPVPTGDTLSGYQIALGAGAHPSVKACREDFSVAYHRVPRLFATLALARGDGRYGRIPKSIAKTDLLILDDWGPEKLSDDQRRDLLEIIEDRYERRSTIVTSQVPLDRWWEIISNPTPPMRYWIASFTTPRHRYHWRKYAQTAFTDGA